VNLVVFLKFLGLKTWFVNVLFGDSHFGHWGGNGLEKQEYQIGTSILGTRCMYMRVCFLAVFSSVYNLLLHNRTRPLSPSQIKF
jgi:hypothetical protein